MSTAFKPENILEYKTPAELTKFVEAKLRPNSDAVRWGCASEVEKIMEFIEEVFPLPITYVTKVLMMPHST